jgi:hypothetical protein
MGHARHGILIAKVSDMNIQRSASLVGLGVVDEKRFEAILQTDDTVLPIIQRGDL